MSKQESKETCCVCDSDDGIAQVVVSKQPIEEKKIKPENAALYCQEHIDELFDDSDFYLRVIPIGSRVSITRESNKECTVLYQTGETPESWIQFDSESDETDLESNN